MLKLSDFQSIQDDAGLLERIALGVLKIFSSEENQDLCLKMTCAEWMKNFYNDASFKVQTYTHLLPPVLEMASNMLSKCQQNMEAVNEILDLFRFVIDKYAAMSVAMANGLTANEYLIGMLSA